MRRKLRLAVGAAASALVFAVLASPAWSAAWRVIPEESRLAFVGAQTGSEFEGEFQKFDADILFDPEDLAASKVVVTIDMGSADAGSKDRNESLPQADWFSIKAFPTARFETVAIRAAETGEGYVADAKLTIRDATQDVSLPFTLAIDGDTAVMAGETVLNRSDFGVGQGQWADDQWIGYDVKVLVDLKAARIAAE